MFFTTTVKSRNQQVQGKEEREDWVQRSDRSELAVLKVQYVGT